MMELPIDLVMGEIVVAVREKGGVVVVAEPGAGKSTRVPVGVLGAVGKGESVLVLQPRRVAARAVAERIGEERGWEVGREVGYQVRFEKRYGRETRIRVVTEGILTRMMMGDPYLEGIGCVVLDEFHERSLHTDLAAGFLRELRGTVRPELKVVVMSATMEGGAVGDFFGVPVVRSAGRNFPVEVRYRGGRDERLEERVAGAVEEALELEGDILVFLPGVGEIERARAKLGWLEGQGVRLLTLHGSLSGEEQKRVLRREGNGRRVILATNVAETSLTIEGVRVVVDSGLVRVASFDGDRGMNRLDVERVSRASAEQRAGRAGRTASGWAIRLWGEAEQKHLADFNVPEVERVDLCGAVLAVHAWGATDARTFGWFERPSEDGLLAAERVLSMLGAVKEGKLTDAGNKIAAMPAHPRIARMLLAAAGTGLLDEAVNVAVVLSDDAKSGIAELQTGRVPEHLRRAREQLWTVAKNMEPQKSISPPTEIGELLLTAYPDRVVRRRDTDAFAGVMVGGSGVRLAAEAMTGAIAASKFCLALESRHDVRSKKGEAMVTRAVVIEERWLSEMFPGLMREEMGAVYSEEREKVEAVRRKYFGDLILEEDRFGKVGAEEAGRVLGEALRGRARELFLREEGCVQLLARVELVGRIFPKDGWPVWDESELGEILGEACAGKKSLAEVVEGTALVNALAGRLVYPLDRRLEELAPESLEVPSGSRIRLEYFLMGADGKIVAPVLAVRLQEMFGLMDTPAVCGGRVKVLLHLLSPGYKPVQVTGDLKSFWGSAYFEVRKDLRVRYPKHKWPEDPLTARAEAKGKRRG